jgi:hypothetical protein
MRVWPSRPETDLASNGCVAMSRDHHWRASGSKRARTEASHCASRRAGATHILMERSELIERLVPLIPPPRAHQVRYHGILAPCASYRDQVVPRSLVLGSDGGKLEPVSASTDEPEATGAADRAAAGEQDSRPQAAPRDRARRMRWASLLQRVFEIDALRCPGRR